MAQYGYFDRKLTRFPDSYYKGGDLARTEKQKIFIETLELGQVFLHSPWVEWEKFKEKFQNLGVIIDRFEFKQKRMVRNYHNAAAIVLQIGEEVYAVPDIKKQQKFDINSLMT
jgi:hypothetical protein